MDIIERAARALCAKASIDAGAPMATDKEISDFLPYMRAAIEAIREPDEGMLKVAYLADENELTAYDSWQAMIDQALKG